MAAPLQTATLLIAAGVFAALAGFASAQTKPRDRQTEPVAYGDERPPLTVNKRSFLDPGPVVPVGSESSYMTSQTTFNRTPDQVSRRSFYGNESLPAPLEVPGRSQPVFEFASPGLE